MTSLSTFFLFAALAALLGVLGALFWGLVSMNRDGEKHRISSNKMMRLRVTCQGFVILFLFLAYLTK